MMTGAPSLIRTLLIYSVCVPLAIFIGYVITDPLQTSAFVEMGLVAFMLTLPLLLKWHREMLIICWNLGAMLFFLPGRPEAWLAMAWVSFFLAVVAYILNPRQKFLSVPSVTKPLLFLAAVVIGTALLRGNIGIAALGSQTYGGKKYVIILSAIVGFFALTSQRIAPRRAKLLVILFFASAATIILGDLAGSLAPGFYYIYLIFPLGTYGYESVVTDFGSPESPIARMGGIAAGAAALTSAMMAYYGIRGLMDSRKLFRLGVFLLLLFASLLGGFRSVLIMFLLTFAVIFYLEGLVRSKLMPAFVIGLVLISALTIGFVDRLPLNVQRTISFLPIPVDPMAKASAEDSTEWRVKMWKDLFPQIPRYLLLGKGLGFSADDLQALTTSRIGKLDQMSSEGSALAGDYHNGPLSVIIPFGIWGALGWFWFIIASFRLLYDNYKFGHPAFKRLNTFLFGYFIAKTVFFFVIFGSFFSDLPTFTGLIALSIAVNGGVAKPVYVRPLPNPATQPFKIHPARQQVGAVS